MITEDTMQQGMKGQTRPPDWQAGHYGRSESTLPARDLYRVTALQGVRASYYWAWGFTPADAVRQVTQQRECEPVSVEEPSTVYTIEVV